MEKEKIENILSGIKDKVIIEIHRKNYDAALGLISVCAQILYKTNLYYMDTDLESYIENISAQLIAEKSIVAKTGPRDDGAVIFYDGFGLNNRGLAQIYLKALGKAKKLCYVTYESRKNSIPDLLGIVSQCGGESFFIEDGTPVGQIQQLTGIVNKVDAGHFFFYSNPDDVVATTVMFAFGGLMTRYQINLTDHAFWIGAKPIDKCIEFRDYGAYLSAQYRNIPKSKIVMLPFYPQIDKEKRFKGYPFKLDPDQKVIFSGGSLYKTLGEGNLYYHIVDYILAKYKEVVFWYAGTGDDSEMKKLTAKYQGRVYLTEERDDLYQVLRNCYLYLNTYPICGGLMYQYAACAERVPLTFRFDADTDGFLIDQKALGVDFDDVDSLKAEIDKLMTDEEYMATKSQRLGEAVISAEEFTDELDKILNGEGTKYPIKYNPVDTSAFKQIYLDGRKPGELNELLAVKLHFRTMLKHFPFRTFYGGLRKLFKKTMSRCGEKK